MRDDARMNMGLRLAGLSGTGATDFDDDILGGALADAGLTVY